MGSSLPLEEQVALLMRGVTHGDPQITRTMEAELRERLGESLRTGRPLTVYLGVDPTSSDLHLGHTVPLRKLRQFQDLGHTVIFLIGTFTGLIGDPSDKDAARRQQTPEEARAHAATYVDQVWTVLDRERTTVAYNDEWLSRLDFAEVVRLASQFTVQQFLARDNFRARHAAGDPIWLHEFFYALMQAYDALHLRADVQVGGTEQLFNLMAGRRLMAAAGLRPQICLTLPILVGTDGRLRMSKSTGNTIGIREAPEVQYGKVMSIPDGAMRNYAELVTRWSPAEIEAAFAALEAGTLHPRDLKMRLAREVVAALRGDAAADAAEAHFRTVAQERAVPDGIPVVTLTGETDVVALLVAQGLAPSRSAARRLIAQGGVRLDGRTVADPEERLAPQDGLLQVGKHRFVRLTARRTP